MGAIKNTHGGPRRRWSSPTDGLPLINTKNKVNTMNNNVRTLVLNNAPVRQFSFTANLNIAKLTKDTRGYTTLVFTGANNSQDLSIKMNAESKDIYDTLMAAINNGKLDANSRVSVVVNEYDAKSVIYLRVANKTANGGNMLAPITGIASVMLLNRAKQAA